MSLAAEGIQGVKAILEGSVGEGPAGTAGLVFHAVDKSGNTLVQHAAGNLGLDTKQPMNDDTMFWIASCTKFITAIALLQLVEQGKIALDDAEAVKKYAPEISKKLVYADGINGAPQEKDVTLSMLLSHTAGFGYTFIDPRIPAGVEIEGQHGNKDDILNARMVNQPGSMWEYGVNMDWAGIILERITGQTLGDYFAEYIFKPVGVDTEGLTMFPSAEAQKNLAVMHQRDPKTGEIKERTHFYGTSLKQQTKEQQDAYLQAGGAGLFAKPKEYCKILAAILNDGTSPQTGKTILKKETTELLYKNQIPNQPDFARGGPAPANLELINHVPEFYPQPENPPQGWTYAGFQTIAPGPSGRGANTIWWMGLINSFWWVDREKGVAGFMGGQILPNGDPKIIPAWFMCEKTVYDHLK